MKRPFLVWLAFAACALVGGGVLAWFTSEMLRLDRESGAARRLAAVEENIRLALWRMDSALASIHGLEASPTGGGLRALLSRKHRVRGQPDPLGRRHRVAPLSAAWLHAAVCAVAFPDRTRRCDAFSAGASRSVAPGGAQRRPHDRPTRRRREGVERPACSSCQNRPRRVAAASAARTIQRTHARCRGKTRQEIRLVTRTQRSLRPAGCVCRKRSPGGRGQTKCPRATARRRATRRGRRAATQECRRTGRTRQHAGSVRALQCRDRRPTQSGAGANPRRERVRRSPPVRLVGRLQVQGTRGRANFGPGLGRDRRTRSWWYRAGETFAAAPQGADIPAVIAEADAAQATVALAGGSTEGPLQAVWAGSDLVFARRAVVDGRNVVQGAWLDWSELEAWLLSRVSDLLPQARLTPALRGTASTAFDAARRLAFLPAQLVPGMVSVDTSSLASPLRISIGLAWAGAAIGLVALALLLRGTLRLSERRGAFVSAVTHELRTPLTTFRMYTEMLSSGMVTDEAKRRGYVDTLQRESERLSHLVENVLSYARLERGRAAARVEDTTPGALLARIEERLRQRAQQGGLAVRVEFAEGIADTPLRTDTTAVEQVLFNLVDNATKYGRPKNSGNPVAGVGDSGPASTRPATAQAATSSITISIARVGPGRLAIRVADQGPGLTFAARKRLFQPFSKSATEAAHSQPGVGLGLALCRRLARDELHGDLALEHTGSDGTVFRLELPV